VQFIDDRILGTDVRRLVVTPVETAALRASKITALAAAICPVCSGLMGPFQPNIHVWKVAR